MPSDDGRLHLLFISVHGLIRGKDPELGRDADTGGQTRYVVELARALGAHPQIARVDLLTRRVLDSSVSADYARHEEMLSDTARIIRLDCGEDAYLPKEHLWDCLDVFADNALHWLRENELTPDIVHSHYADAGYVGIRLSSQLGVPLVHTGHSLGRVKRRRLLAADLHEGHHDAPYRAEQAHVGTGRANGRQRGQPLLETIDLAHLRHPHRAAAVLDRLLRAAVTRLD
jgi:sucrose-phosphate synthase